MLNRILLLAVLFALPSVIYYISCLILAKRNKQQIKKLQEFPWLKLFASGLLIVILAAVSLALSGGESIDKTYIPPKVEGGRVVPAQTR